MNSCMVKQEMVIVSVLNYLVFHVKKNMLVGVFLDLFFLSSLPSLELWPLVIWLRAPLVLKEW